MRSQRDAMTTSARVRSTPAAAPRLAGRARWIPTPWFASAALVWLMLCPVWASGPAIAAAAQATAEQVRSAASAVRADPALGGTRKEQTWHFRSFFDDENPEPKKPDEPPMAWLLDLARWLEEGGRGLVWLLGAVLVAVILVGARRWISFKGLGGRDGAVVRPSHVRDLDIRPESLPDDVGRVARELWLAGSHRAALSLLYRGTLSRLVHGFAVPIKSASTEGDCVSLAERALPADASGFVRRLVGAWQFAVYGAHLPDSAAVLALCDEFDSRLGAAPLAPAAA